MSDDLATLLGKRFIQRKDVKAVQHPNGAYTPDRNGWKMSDLRAHISGQATYGHYLIGSDDHVKLVAFDLDLTKEGYWFDFRDSEETNLDPIPCNPREVWATPGHPGQHWLTVQLRCTAEAIGLKAKRLFKDFVHVCIANSGSKGLHVYCLFPEPLPAVDARGMGISILEAFNGPDGRPGFQPIRGENFWIRTDDTSVHNLTIEVYPKQDSLDGKDLGNLLRLPLGVNRKSGQRSYFLDCRCPYHELRVMDPVAALSGELPWDYHL